MIHAEYHEATMVHQWLEVRGIPHTHITNEQPNRKRAVAEKRMGKSAGFPDFLIFLPSGVNVAVELKRADKGAKATPAQRKWLYLLSTRGFECAVCHGAQEVVEFLKQLGYTDGDNTVF